MDFLMDAQKQNKRRVQLEHLILLLLRCLAILLLALLFSQPVFDPSGFGSRTLGSHEHVILVDDSPSMGAMHNNTSSFDQAKDSLSAFLHTLSQDHAGDSVTLLLTSQPDRPLVAGKQVSPETLEDVLSIVDTMGPSAFPARYDGALLALEKLANASRSTTNRTCYVVSDFRRADWLVKDRDRGAVAILKRLLGNDVGVSVIDFGGDREQNVAVVGITPPKSMIVAGVPTRFEVTVANHGNADVDDLEVTFSAAGSLPVRKTVTSLAPGAQSTLPFTFTFGEAGGVTVEASIGVDALPADNVRHLCTQVVEGIRILLVDGEPSGMPSSSETFFMDRALAPSGDVPSGYLVETISELQLETVKLDNYQMLALCNVTELVPDVLKRLDAWVRNGGGLVWFLGDRVDPDAYNEMATSHPGLIPVTLVKRAGDETEKTWRTFGDTSVTHPVLRLFEGGAFLRQAKFFQWWETTIPKSEDPASVVASLNDSDNTPVIVERALDDGSVMAFTSAADDEWSTWVSDPSYLVTMQEMARYLAKRTVTVADLPVGAPLTYQLDPAIYATRAKVYRPGKAHFDQVQAAPMPESKLMELGYDQTTATGPYRVALERLDGGRDEAHFAVNLGAEEGLMARVGEWQSVLGDDAQKLVANTALVASKDTGGRIQLWRPILILLILVLCVEQVLARYFGSKRQAAATAAGA